MKNRIIKRGVCALMLLIAAPFVSANIYWNALTEIYDIFFGETDWLVIGVIDETPTVPEWYKNHYYETNRFVEAGKLGWEPTVTDASGIRKSWSNAHFDTCTATNAFQKMPITGTPDGYSDVYTPTGTKTIKRFTVQKGVPHRFTAKTHGGLTDLMSDSFYFFSFGDGIRQYNKKGDDEGAEHVYHGMGTYTLSSLVYTEEWSIFFGISGSTYGDLSINDSSLDFDLEKNGDLYLEGCDVAEVTVVKNNAPTARIRETRRTPNTRTTNVSLTGSSSSDPDGNTLSYTWRYGSQTKTGKNVTFNFSNPEVGTASYTVTLTVTDGDKSDTTTRNVYISPYCYSCNGYEIP